MKKLLFATCLAMLSLGAFASSSIEKTSTKLDFQIKSNENAMVYQYPAVSGYLTSSCGVTWYYEYEGLAPYSVYATQLQTVIDIACITGETYYDGTIY